MFITCCSDCDNKSEVYFSFCSVLVDSNESIEYENINRYFECFHYNLHSFFYNIVYKSCAVSVLKSKKRVCQQRINTICLTFVLKKSHLVPFHKNMCLFLFCCFRDISNVSYGCIDFVIEFYFPFYSFDCCKPCVQGIIENVFFSPFYLSSLSFVLVYSNFFSFCCCCCVCRPHLLLQVTICLCV